MVLDRVVSAAFEDLGDLGPLVVDDSVHEEQDPLFFLAPVDLLDSWVQVVVPPLAALLAHAAIQVLGNESPLLGPVGNYELEYAPVFLGSPGAFDAEILVVSHNALLILVGPLARLV